MNSITITLGRLIELLSKRDPQSPVRFDFGRFVPVEIASYRGYYDHLALSWELPNRDATLIVADVLRVLNEAVGSTFTGWKGGTYRMDRSTPVWVARAGECHDTGIIGLADCEHETIIATAWCNAWEWA